MVLIILAVGSSTFAYEGEFLVQSASFVFVSVICHFVGYYAFIKDGSAVLWIIVVLFLTVFWLVGVLVLVVCSCEVLHVVVLFLVAWAW